jgi:hypothetical protein
LLLDGRSVGSADEIAHELRRSRCLSGITLLRQASECFARFRRLVGGRSGKPHGALAADINNTGGNISLPCRSGGFRCPYRTALSVGGMCSQNAARGLVLDVGRVDRSSQRLIGGGSGLIQFLADKSGNVVHRRKPRAKHRAGHSANPGIGQRARQTLARAKARYQTVGAANLRRLSGARQRASALSNTAYRQRRAADRASDFANRIENRMLLFAAFLNPAHIIAAGLIGGRCFTGMASRVFVAHARRTNWCAEAAQPFRQTGGARQAIDLIAQVARQSRSRALGKCAAGRHFRKRIVVDRLQPHTAGHDRSAATPAVVATALWRRGLLRLPANKRSVAAPVVIAHCGFIRTALPSLGRRNKCPGGRRSNSSLLWIITGNCGGCI